MEDTGMKDEEGFALLGRRDGGYLEVLALQSNGDEVLCLFETQRQAEAFAKVSPDIRGQGWQVHVMTAQKLPELLKGFDYVTINPSSGQDSQQELVSAEGFARSLQHRGID